MADDPRTYVRMSDDMPENDKIVLVGGDAAWLHFCAICYCSRNLTDGMFPKAMVSRLSDRKSPQRLAAKLVEHGMWIDHGDRYEIHDYLDHQRSRAEVEDLRNKRRKAGSKGGKAKANGVASAKASASHVAKQTASKTLPVSESDTEQGQDHDGAVGANDDWPRIVNDGTFTDKVVGWARSHGHMRQVETREDVTRWCLDLAENQLAGSSRFTGAACELVVEWVEHACGEPLATSARKHLVRLMNTEGPKIVFAAMAESVKGGAGLSEQYAEDPQALVRYAKACITRWRTEGARRVG